MELRDYLKILRKRAVPAVLVFLLAVIASGVITLLSPTKYTANSQVFVAVSSSSQDIASALTGSNFTLQRVKSYSQLVKTPSVLGPASAQLGFTIDPDVVSASIPLDTVLIDIEATDDNASRAARIANAVAAQLGAVVVELETPLDGTTSPVKTKVVERAETPTAPTSPRPLLNIALGLLLGAAGAIGIVLLLESLDQTIRTPEDVQELTGSSPIGVLPFDAQAKKAPLSALNRRSTHSEGFRTVRTNLQFVDVDNPPRAIVVTSSVPSEGKTTTAINLAIAMAQSGQRVLLVEADLRKPKVGEYLGIDTSQGLTDVLTFTAPLAQVLQPWHRDLLVVLPGGTIPPNPSELLSSSAMARLLLELKTMFDVIIIDAPPLLPVSDAAILAGIADGALFVTRWGSTRRQQVSAALDQLAAVGGRVLGTIVNFAPLGKRGYHYGYGYGYGYRGKYGYGYGQGEGDAEVTVTQQHGRS
jgi:capsular exopolysaccharide synthesis family protein